VSEPLTTGRLLLRRWREADREPFAAMNADVVVMEHFPSLMTRAQSDGAIERIEELFERDGFGLWALEERATGEFLGFTGLQRVGFDAPFVPAVEVGWRLRASAWGRGYATEAATASLADGFGTAGLDEIVSFTTPRNTRSIAVMERLGMERDPDGDFEHPRIPAGHAIRLHVLYRLSAAAWRGRS
jgi:RimJ/RimL family protein N-acetyltransferase